MSLFRSFAMGSVVCFSVCVPFASVLAAENASATTTEPTSTQATSTTFVFFHMADGRFFHPGTGLTADSEAELRHLVTGEPLPAPAAPTGTAIQPFPLLPNPPISPSTDSSTVPEVPVLSPILAAIEQGRTELQRRIVEERAVKASSIVRSTDVWLDVTLAVWNKTTNQLGYIDLQKKGSQIRNVRGTESSVKLVRSNGVNSAFRIGTGTDEIVVALRHPILKPTSSKKKTTYTIEDVVYTPYSEALHTPEVVEAGRQYLDQVVDQVYAKLRADGISSRVFPDRLAVDVVDPGVVKSIAAIEHLDQSGLVDDPRHALESFLIVLAGNKEHSYAYSRSSAGALGLVQFIPSTYTHLAAQTGLGLEKDFETAMGNPLNAIRAQVLYLDVIMDEFPNSFRDRLAANPSRAQEFVVAAYNGGTSRVRKAMSSWDGMFDGTEAHDLNKLRAKYAGMKETIESLRQKTLRQKEKKARAKLQAQLDAKRVEAKKLLAQINADESALLRNETISYVRKYRALQQGELFPLRVTSQVTTPTANQIVN